MLLLDFLEGFQTIGAGNDLITFILQIKTNAFDQQRFVIYNKNFHNQSPIVM